MKERLTPWVVLALGLVPVLGIGFVPLAAPYRTLVIVFFFLALNLQAARNWQARDRLQTTWHWRRTWWIIPGIVLGAFPIGVAYSVLHWRGELAPFRSLPPSVVAMTFLTILWEELWFRGAALELAARQYGRVIAVVSFAVIFAGLHALNPALNLLIDGPMLVLAGYVLGVAYFASNSLWFPVGMHFANNLAPLLFGEAGEPRTGIYLSLMLALAIGFTLLPRCLEGRSFALRLHR